MATVTVTGALGHHVVVNFDYPEYAMLATSLLADHTASDLMATKTIGHEKFFVTTGPTLALGENNGMAKGTSGTAGTGALDNVTDGTGDSGQVVLTGTGTDLDFTSTMGSGTIVAGGGSDTFNLGSGDWDVYTGMQGDMVTLGAGNDTLTMGGPDTVTAGSGSLLVYGVGDGSSIIGGSGSIHYVAQDGSTTTIMGGMGMVDATAADNASVTFSGTTSGNIFTAGAGSETLDASGATGNNSFYAVGGSDSVTAGSGNDTLFASGGASTLTGGAGTNYFTFASDGVAGNDVVTDFTSSDYVQLVPSLSVVSQADVGSNLLMTLSDGTTVTFDGVSSIDPSHIIG